MVGRAVLTAFDALAIEVHDPCTCGHIEIGILSSLRQVMLHPFDFTDCRVRCRNPCSIFLGLRGWFIRHRSEEHTSELQSLMRISYAVFCLKNKKTLIATAKHHITNTPQLCLHSLNNKQKT